eukprot:s1398_g6.t1
MAGGFLLVSLLVLAASSDLKGPCDIYAEGHTPCVAAHSLTRYFCVSRRGCSRLLSARLLLWERLLYCVSNLRPVTE